MELQSKMPKDKKEISNFAWKKFVYLRYKVYNKTKKTIAFVYNASYNNFAKKIWQCAKFDFIKDFSQCQEINITLIKGILQGGKCKMKKKVLSVLLSTAMVASVLAGCGSKAEAPAEAPAAEETAEEEAPAEEDAPAEEEAEEAVVVEDAGKVLNIYCWNEKFKSCLTDHYPGYEEIDGTHGKIGDIDVVWNITPSDNNAYQNNLDETLSKQADAADDDKIDLFLIEADYALKYVNTDYTMSVSELGITADELSNQYTYTQDVVTDENGQLKGVSWQGCPGVMIYNREIANDVFGTDDPDTIQASFSDWDKFQESAGTLKEKGYSVTATVNDTYRVFSNNVTSKWVEDGALNIDDNLVKWVDMSKALYDGGMTTTSEIWSDDWSKGFYPEGKVFCYFGPAGLIDSGMHADDPDSIAANGGWAACEGPQRFFWGGTWVCAATGTDNAGTVADIIRKLTCDVDIMTEIVKADNEFVNNKEAMEAMAADTSYANKVLGGQNPLAMFCAGAEKIDLSTISAYDQGCNESFQQAMKNYFEGQYTYDEAIDAFKKAVKEKYPELNVD